MEQHDQKQQSMRIQAPMGERQSVSELSSDFTLPDYQPEIKRLLRVRASVNPADQYLGAGKAELSGTVDYCILYSGNDGELYCTTQTADYRVEAPVELPPDFEIGEGLICDADFQPEQVSARVAAPRKLTVKCRLRSKIRMYGTRVLSENLPDGGDPALQRLWGEFPSARVSIGTGEPLRLGDEILLDAQEGDVRVICGEGQVFVSDTNAGSGIVTCRGEVSLKLLCCREGGMPYSVTRRIPFTQEIPVDGVEVNCDTCASGVCSDLRITVEENRILCDLALSLLARAQKNETVAYVRDLYSTAAACETSYAEIPVSRAVKCLNGNFSLGTALPLAEAGLRAGELPVDLCATAFAGPTEADRGKTYVTGRCRFHLITSCDGELNAHELELPFRYETDGVPELPTEADLAVTPVSCRAKIDSERVAIDAELAVAAAFRASNSVRVLSGVKIGEPLPARPASCTVCFPAPDDTLWSVAGRYHVPVADLLAGNPLPSSAAADSPDSLAGVRYLMI